MIRHFRTAAMLAAAAVALSACVIAGPGYGGRGGCRWVAPHYGPEGGWHPGHCV